MKKTTALILVFVLCLSLCACGADKDLAGEYECVGYYSVGLAKSYRLNEDGTYEVTTPISVVFGDLIERLGEEDEDLKRQIESYKANREKGTYEATKDGFKLTPIHYQGDTFFQEIQDSYYVRPNHGFRFEKDNEYGKVVTFSKDGKCNQEFEYRDYSTNDNYVLTLREDGTFLWSVYDVSDYQKKFAITTYEGTYSLDKSILTLTAPEWSQIFIYTNDTIYTAVYKKVA